MKFVVFLRFRELSLGPGNRFGSRKWARTTDLGAREPFIALEISSRTPGKLFHDWPAPEAGLYFFKMSEQIKIEKDLQVISRLAISQFARRNVAGEANPVGGLCPEPGHRQGRRLGEEEPVRYITFGEERTVAAIFAWEEDASQQ